MTATTPEVAAARPRTDVERILDLAEAQIRRIQGSDLPAALKSDRIEDYMLQAGRDLDRAAAHKRRIVELGPGAG